MQNAAFVNAVAAASATTTQPAGVQSTAVARVTLLTLQMVMIGLRESRAYIAWLWLA